MSLSSRKEVQERARQGSGHQRGELGSAAGPVPRAALRQQTPIRTDHWGCGRPRLHRGRHGGPLRAVDGRGVLPEPDGHRCLHAVDRDAGGLQPRPAQRLRAAGQDRGGAPIPHPRRGHRQRRGVPQLARGGLFPQQAQGGQLHPVAGLPQERQRAGGAEELDPCLRHTSRSSSSRSQDTIMSESCMSPERVQSRTRSTPKMGGIPLRETWQTFIR